MKKIKIAFIGVGNIAETHLHGYLRNPHVEVYAFCDIRKERLDAMGEKYGITRLYTNMHEMLKLEEIDAVSVCTWNCSHAECAIAALDAGKHVLCEKPMAASVAEAIAMKEAAERNHKRLMIGFVRRFGNDCALMRDMDAADYFGEIYYAKANYLRRNGNPGGWFGDKARSGGGPLIDLGVHIIDFARYIMGNPKPISVYGATFTKLYDRKNIKDKGNCYLSSAVGKDDICDVEDMATALIRFDNGAVLSVEASFSLNIKKDNGTIEFFGTKGGAKLDPELELYSEVNGYLADVNLVTESTTDGDELFQREIDHFVDCVMDESIQCISPAEDGIDIMKILMAVYESAETGHEVQL